MSGGGVSLCPPFHLLAMPASVQRTFSKAVRCSFPLPYIFRPFSVFPRAHAAFFILTLSPFPIRFRAGPLLTGSPLETLTARFGDPPSSARVLRDFLNFPELPDFLSSLLWEGSYSRRVSSNSFLSPSSASVFSDACQHSFSLTGLGGTLLLPYLGNPAHSLNALMSG